MESETWLTSAWGRIFHAPLCISSSWETIDKHSNLCSRDCLPSFGALFRFRLQWTIGGGSLRSGSKSTYHYCNEDHALRSRPQGGEPVDRTGRQGVLLPLHHLPLPKVIGPVDHSCQMALCWRSVYVQHLSLASIAVSTTLTKGEQLHKSLLLVWRVLCSASTEESGHRSGRRPM